MKAEPLGLARARPIGPRGLKQIIGAGDIGIDKIARAVDGTVHMGFSGQMHHHIGLMLRKCRVQHGAVADVHMGEMIKRAVRHRRQVFQASRIGQRIDIHHLMAPTDGQPHNRRANKTGPPCD